MIVIKSGLYEFFRGLPEVPKVVRMSINYLKFFKFYVRVTARVRKFI